jgi:CubicO group peptidase (beta-lactamase class C family)
MWPLPRAANSGPRDAMADTGRNSGSRSLAVYAFLLQLYAPAFLARHRAEMLQNFEDLENASSSKVALWLLVGEDLTLSIISRKVPKSIWGYSVPAFIVLVAVFAVLRAFAQDLTQVNNPEALGFSSSRLARIETWQQSQVDAGAFSGAVAVIARNGKVAYLRAVGFRDQAKTIPLRPDAIFWIASMTKPVTSVAAMILVEQGKLDLAAPVHHYLPELKDMKVGVETRDSVSGQSRLTLEPQKRPMTVEDLLRHTSGLVYPDGNTTVHKFYRDTRQYWPSYARDLTLKDLVSGLKRIPLAYQPGEVFEYGLSVEVLGRVIEVASGQPLDQFLDRSVFKPLGMIDTDFWVPPEKVARLIDPPAGVPIHPDRDVTIPTTMFSASSGLVSTAADYLRFCQMLLNGGELDGERLLSSATVRRMTTNALPSDIHFAGNAAVGPWGGSTFGLGFAIRTDAMGSWVPGSVGSYTWTGRWGSFFWVDPTEQLIAIQLIQTGAEDYDQFWTPFRNLTYGAFLVPQRVAAVAATRPAAIDPAALAAFKGTYRFASSSSRDRQERREFGGLGIEVAMQNGVLKVLYPLRNTPAARAGVIANDIITGIDDAATQRMSLNQALEKMRGPVDTTVRLKIARKGQDGPIELAITRAVIRPEVAGSDLQVSVKDGKLLMEGRGALPVLDFKQGVPIAAVPMSSNEFVVDGGERTRLAFSNEGTGEPTGLVLNPGPWQITGHRIN